MLKRPFPVLLTVLVTLVVCFAVPTRAAETDLERTDPEIREIWLRYHEADLCQSLDAVFVFQPKGLEVWCVVEDERSFERLKEMIDPLRSKFQIELYPTVLPQEKKSLEDRDPPPSLWNNMELRAYLSDPMLRTPALIEMRDLGIRRPEAEVQLKQRIFLFAEQTLDWDTKVKRYGSEIPELTELALDPAVDPQTRARARSVSIAHAQAIERFTSRLTENLTQAFPRPRTKSKNAKLPHAPPSVGDKTALADAIRLANSTGNIASRVYRFVHPRSHTVPIGDLKEPSLLESLRLVIKESADFQRSLAESKP